MMTGARILWECLEREGVKTVFGYRWGDPAGIRRAATQLDTYILVRHEQGRRTWPMVRARHRRGRRSCCDFGSGRDEHGHRYCHGHDGLLPHRVHHRTSREQAFGSDAFQETDITGVTLPITKHNYLVTRADEIAHAVREAMYVANPGARDRCLDITKDAQQSSCELDWEGAAPKMRGYRPDLSPAKEEYERPWS